MPTEGIQNTKLYVRYVLFVQEQTSVSRVLIVRLYNRLLLVSIQRYIR